MKTITPAEVDSALLRARLELGLARSVRKLHRRNRRPDRLLDLETCHRLLPVAAAQLRPLVHAAAWQPIHRADEVRAASAALQNERRLIRRMLARS